MPLVLHQPRVAWDFARVAISVAAADDELFAWFSDRLGELLGPPYRRELVETRVRLAAPNRVDITPAEAGVWRTRIEDLLRRAPDLTEGLDILRLDANSRLGSRAGRAR